MQAVTAEMRALHFHRAGMRLDVEPAVAFAVVAMCQLGLRHPQVNGPAAQRAQEFIEYVRAKFEVAAPAIAEAIRRGNDAASDDPREQPQT